MASRRSILTRNNSRSQSLIYFAQSYFARVRSYLGGAEQVQVMMSDDSYSYDVSKDSNSKNSMLY